MADEIQGKKPIQLWEDLTRRENQLTNDHVLMSQKTTGSPEEPVKVIKQEHALHPSTSKSDVVTDSEDLIILAGTGDSKTAKKVKPSRLIGATVASALESGIDPKKANIKISSGGKAYDISSEDLFGQMNSGDMQGIYGVMYRENGEDFEYVRTGTLAGVSAESVAPEHLLTVHNKLKRGILKADGSFQLLDADNSALLVGTSWSEASAITEITEDYSAGTISVTTSSLTSDDIGKYCKITSPANSKEFYALITDVSGSVATLSHPHIIDFGKDNDGVMCTQFYKGTAKFRPEDGNLMVEIPEHYHKCSQADVSGNKWVHHQLSLNYFPGAMKKNKRYFPVFPNGVGVNASNKASDGWTGSFVSADSKWTVSGDQGSVKKLMSVPGFYPRTSTTISTLRTLCKANGEGFHQLDFESYNVIQSLILVEFASFKSQEKISEGITDITGSISWGNYNGSRSVRKNGDSIPAGNKTWRMDTDPNLNHKMQITGATGGWLVKSFSYRGIENLYGNLWKFVDGINMIMVEEGTARYFKAMVSDNPVNHNSDSDTGLLQLPAKVYTHAKSTNSHRYPRSTNQHFLPADTPNASNILPSGSSGSFLSDFFFVPSYPSDGLRRILLVGGSAHNSSYAGAFFWHSFSGSGASSVDFGGGLCKILANS